MNATTVFVIVIALLCLALGALAGLWAGRRMTPAPGSDDAEQTTLPIAESLRRVERFLQSSEAERAEAHGELREQVRAMHEQQAALGTHTTSLINALRAPHVRGRWGEMQLRRIVESSGMIDHCDFSEQHRTSGVDGELRPDLVVHLTGGRAVVVDAKVPFTAFIAALEADDASRTRLYREHAKQVRSHMETLSARAYPSAVTESPEFTVMFLPSDAFLQLALQHEPALLEFGFDRDIVIATPSTLLALLRTVAHTWRQDTISREAQQILQLGQQLHQRLGTFAGHLSKLGASLGSAVGRYNDAVGSLERSVMVPARKMQEAGIARTALDAPGPIDRAVRELHVADPPDRADPPGRGGLRELPATGEERHRRTS
ncbi:DNA recombination protein RmuC [Epidermidibacterium keratini]|uniref:DNA recombination protein RmuC n=1 Tax=Epidermidibacterium keratini TaxID=1891644 RepID=A0A7L4YMA0_9ACTN|nr:DNA recombination protein RmuC [Epidermidibacterium keratini]QHB99676.1 DNA recombination protein RmuC [Epidermidibacterium keratini]